MDGVRQATGAAKLWQRADPPSEVGGTRPELGLSSDQQRSKLARIIEGDIIPRLMLAHRAMPDCADFVADEAGIQQAVIDVPEFTKLVLTHEVKDAAAYIEVLRSRGRSLDSVLLDVLAPTARRLGEMWENDLCDFVDVTVGLSRLQALLRELNPAGTLDIDPSGEGGRRVLLVPAPGEQHTFGISMVEKFFRMSGWEVWGGAFGCNVDVVELVRCEPFAVVGFSVSTEGRLPALKGQIATIRRESCNPAVGVLVGGSLFAATPDLVAYVGADGTATDGPGAVLSAESLLDSTTRAC